MFPILAVFAAFAGTRLRTRWQGKLVIGALALLASLAITAAYHLGYSQFRRRTCARRSSATSSGASRRSSP